MDTGELLVDSLRRAPRLAPAALATAWRGVRETGLRPLVSREGAVLWLLRRLDAQVAASAAPPAFVQWLRDEARGITARNLLVDAEAEGMLQLLADRGTPHVAIKGTARRASLARYPGADARLTHDVDLLLPEQEVQPLWEHLRSLGWSFAKNPLATPAGHYHPPPLLGPLGIAVELHSATSRGVSASECWRRATDESVTVEWHGRSVRVPGATELLWHALTHAMGDGIRGFALRYFLDATVLLVAAADLDWTRLSARLAAGEVPDAGAARQWLGAAADLAGTAIPASVMAGASPFDTPTALNWRLAVLARRSDVGFGARLLEEGTRAELGMPPAEVVPGTGVLKQTRRRLGGRAARTIYRLWRVTRSRP